MQERKNAKEEMTEREKAIDKIKKLLKLSQSPYDSEAKTALMKARELMVKFHVDELSLNVQEKDKVECESIEIDDCMTLLCHTIATNNRCEAYHLTNKSLGKKHYYLMVVGYKFDIECVRVMCEYAHDYVTVGVRELRRRIRSREPVVVNGQCYDTEYTDTKGLKQNYINGFIKGIKIEYARQFKEDNENKLVVVTPPEVKKNYEEKRKDFKSSYNGAAVKVYNTESRNNILAYYCGVESGKEMAGKKRLGSAECDNNN